jgi:hypothetical protein
LCYAAPKTRTKHQHRPLCFRSGVRLSPKGASLQRHSRQRSSGPFNAPCYATRFNGVRSGAAESIPTRRSDSVLIKTKKCTFHSSRRAASRGKIISARSRVKKASRLVLQESHPPAPAITKIIFHPPPQNNNKKRSERAQWQQNCAIHHAQNTHGQ